MADNSNNNIYKKLESEELLEALEMLQTKVNGLGNWQLQSDLEQVTDTYSNMLSFLRQGVTDTEYGHMRQELIRKAYTINDLANRDIRLKNNPHDLFCKTYTKFQATPMDMQAITAELETLGEQITELNTNPTKRENVQKYQMEHLLPQHDALMEQLFNGIWVSDLWTQKDHSACLGLLCSESILLQVKLTVISAVTIASYELLDPYKIKFLFDFSLDSTPEISQRALVGLILLIIRYNNRKYFQAQIEPRFRMYTDDSQFSSDCFRILKQLQYCMATDSISEKMNQDILPFITNAPGSINIRMDDEGTLTAKGENPEWLRKQTTDDQFEKKMRQISNLQMDGADVNWNSFSNLKKFQFFNKTYHWFVPFTDNYTETYELSGKLKKEILNAADLLFTMSTFCDSDKFSFMMMLGSLPQQSQDLIASHIQVQVSSIEAMEEYKERKKVNKVYRPSISRSYIFDLYRFFKAHPDCSQFFDPFKKLQPDFDPTQFGVLKDLLTTDNYDETVALAEFMMHKERYKSAVNLFQSLNPKEREEDVDIWQKIGFCEQKDSETYYAISDYEVAHRLQPDSKWTLTHLAQVYLDECQFDDAEIIIDEILKIDPDNQKWIRNKIECMLALEEYKESLPFLYKATYLDEESEDLQFMLGKALYCTGEKDKAKHVMAKWAEKGTDLESLMYIAFAHYMDGDTKAACSFFSKAYKAAKDKTSFQSYYVYYAEDFDLDFYGKGAEELHMLLDAIIATTKGK